MKVSKIKNVAYKDVAENVTQYCEIIKEQKYLALEDISFNPMYSQEQEELLSSINPIDYVSTGSIKGFMSLIHTGYGLRDPEVIAGQSGHVHSGAPKIHAEGYNSLVDRDYIFSHWHVDESPIESQNVSIPMLICMHMRTFKCESRYGRTIFVDREQMLNNMEKSILNKIKRMHVVSVPKSTYCPEKIKDYNITPEELFEGEFFTDSHGIMHPMRIFPAVSTHKITGKNCLTVHSNSQFQVLLSTDQGLRRDFYSYIDNYLLNEDNWIEFSWKENDFLIWDNSILIHTFSGGWSESERSFDRSNIGEVNPVFDYRSFS